MKKIFLVLALFLSVFILFAEEENTKRTFVVGDNITMFFKPDREGKVYNWQETKTYRITAILPYEKGYIIKLLYKGKESNEYYELFVEQKSALYIKDIHNKDNSHYIFHSNIIVDITPNSFTVDLVQKP